MAGHLPLNKIEEPKLFALIEAIKNKMFLYRRTVQDFGKFSIPFQSKQYKVMRLSDDYVENPETEIAFTVGRVNVFSLNEQHKSLTQNIDVEVHLILNKERNQVAIKNIFWVA